MLGYRDSGMPDSEANARPEAFANADFDEAVGRLVAEIRRTRPQVVITYGDEQQGYPHPDHLRVHDITHPRSEEYTYELQSLMRISYADFCLKKKTQK